MRSILSNGGLVLVGLLGCSDNLARTGLDEPPPPLETTPVDAVSFDAVYVVNGESATISVIDAESNQVAGTIVMRGAAYPHHIALSPDRSTLGIAVPGYDMSAGEFGHEHHASRPGHVVLLDATTGALKAARRTDAANNNVVFSADGSVWTAQSTSPGSTLVLDAATLDTREAIAVGNSPAKTVLSSDGSLAFVANSGSSSVTVIDVAARTVRATLKVGLGPVGAQPGPDGFVYVENEADESVSIIDPASLQVVRTFGIGYQPGSVTTSGNGELWITHPKAGVVEVRNTAGQILRSVETGLGANSVVFAPDGARAYVSNQLDDSVSVIDRKTMTAVAKLKVGSKPNGMAWRSK